VQRRCFQCGSVPLRSDIKGTELTPANILIPLGFYETRHILLSVSANCTVLRAVVLTQYQRVTDGQTDGIAVASTALAKRRAVKTVRSPKPTFTLTLTPPVRDLDRYTSWCGTRHNGAYSSCYDGSMIMEMKLAKIRERFTSQ